MKEGEIEELLLEESKMVFKYLMKIGASKEDAEDIVQDTLYKTFKNIDSIKVDKVKAWLFKVSINSYYSLYSKKKTLVYLTSDEIDTLKPSLMSTEELFLNEQSKKHLIEALNELKTSYKNLLILKYFMDLSYKEIANILEISEQNVKTYLYRARNTFKQIWEDYQNGQEGI